LIHHIVVVDQQDDVLRATKDHTVFIDLPISDGPRISQFVEDVRIRWNGGIRTLRGHRIWCATRKSGGIPVGVLIHPDSTNIVLFVDRAVVPQQHDLVLGRCRVNTILKNLTTGKSPDVTRTIYEACARWNARTVW